MEYSVGHFGGAFTSSARAGDGGGSGAGDSQRYDGETSAVDVGINKPLNNLLRPEYNKCLSADNRELASAVPAIKRASLGTACGWTRDAWSVIPQMGRCGLFQCTGSDWTRTSCGTAVAVTSAAALVKTVTPSEDEF